jgi:hypothetical protein
MHVSNMRSDAVYARYDRVGWLLPTMRWVSAVGCVVVVVVVVVSADGDSGVAGSGLGISVTDGLEVA